MSANKTTNITKVHSQGQIKQRQHSSRW